MTANGIEIEVSSRGVATLWLNRPDKGNAFDDAMLAAFAAALAQLGDDRAVRCVIMRGRGRHFCSGADVASPGGHSVNGPSLPQACALLDTFSKPTIAVAQGACLGGGLALAGCCDILLAVEGATFAIPEIRLGMTPAPLLPVFNRMLGARQLRRYALTGERFSAAEALLAGAAHFCVDVQAVDEVLAKVVDNLLLGGPQAQARTKLLVAGPDDPAEAADLGRQLAAAFVATRDSDEGIEGRAAFREKRPPRWYAAISSAREESRRET